ncbi:S41 family peptidase [Brevundimonas sp.]|uniref:S41 family peptidase n=1 Tax=Brevundimonas sp. TaxID=1871086 RepID=UPI002D5C70FB|nr:S41 family peptidase [Brevundimonas sp.]HYC96807.1 S41 family peptidase [Brevundimonas sp.]
MAVATATVAALLPGLASGALATGVHAQTSSAGAAKVDRSAALRTIQDLISANYVFEDLRGLLGAALRESEAAGRYDVDDPDQFAARVTEDFQRVARDGHLYLRRDASRYAAMTTSADNDQALAALQRSRAIQRNHGLVEMNVRPGNIRYLKLTNFDWVADGSTAGAYDRAAEFLADGDAVILDLRGNGGGQSDAADDFTRKLLRIGEEGVPNRGPVFVLVDGDTGSAAEAVAYDAKVRGAAVIVGARTYGAANNVRHYPVAPDLILSMSYNRPVHPLTGTNWEGTGVLPDLVTDSALALESAELEALKALSDDLPDDSPARIGYEWRAAGLRARLEPPLIDEPTLEAFAGRYGTIEIRYDAGVLKLYRPERPRWPQGARLLPMTPDALFSMEGTDDLRFQFVAGSLQILRPGAAREIFLRLP